MDDKSLLFLFKQEQLNKFFKTLQTIPEAKSRSFDLDKQNKQPHCNVLTSIARILATKEVCGCFHVRENKLLLSTNRETRQGMFRKEIGSLIFQLIQKDFQEKDKLNLYKKCFAHLIKNTAKRYKLELESLQSFKKYIIEIEDWENISLSEIETLHKEIEDFFSKSNEDKTIVTACSRVLIPFRDLKKVCNDLAKPEYEKLRSSITKESLTERFASDDNLHCELAAIERDNKTTKLEELTLELSQKAKNKEFTVSKFCCYMCHLVFGTLNTCHDDKALIDFTYLGNSCIAFPGHKIPKVAKNAFSQKVADALEQKLNDLIQKIKDKQYYIQEADGLIENHELVVFSLPNSENSELSYRTKNKPC